MHSVECKVFSKVFFFSKRLSHHLLISLMNYSTLLMFYLSPHKFFFSLVCPSACLQFLMWLQQLTFFDHWLFYDVSFIMSIRDKGTFMYLNLGYASKIRTATVYSEFMLWSDLKLYNSAERLKTFLFRIIQRFRQNLNFVFQVNKFSVKKISTSN